MTYAATRVQRFGATIFSEMTNLARQHNAINLGQGFPDFAAPEYVKQAAIDALQADINQYPPAIGRPRLREAIAAKMAQQYGLSVDPATQIVATHGATEGIFATIQALVNPGDEVIVFEPYYDSYVPSIEFAGGIARYYTLRPPTWAIDFDELEALFCDKTKLIIINSPHNPTGKVFSSAELTTIATLCHKYDVLVMSDEVYEHITFDGVKHVPMATIDGMADRTVTLSSIGKTFSVTGWKVGWAIASPSLSKAILHSRQWITFAGAAPLEEASAAAMEWAPASGYYDDLQQLYQSKRDRLIAALDAAGLPVIAPQGTYFVMVDIAAAGFESDRAFCYHLTKEVGVAAIPPSVFYATAGEGTTLARFAFCKSDDALEVAGERLRTAFAQG